MKVMGAGDTAGQGKEEMERGGQKVLKRQGQACVGLRAEVPPVGASRSGRGEA